MRSTYTWQLGGTPLTWAAEKGHIEIVKFLLTAGADVNHVNKVLPTERDRLTHHRMDGQL